MSAQSGSHKASVAHESRGEKLPSPLKDWTVPELVFWPDLEAATAYNPESMK